MNKILKGKIEIIAIFLIAISYTTANAANYPKSNFVSWNQTDLYFGTELASGKTKSGPCATTTNTAVTEDEFKCFLDTYVTPRFPYGLTWFAANGQYTDPENPNSQVFKETSYVVILLYPASSTSNLSLDQIRTIYVNEMGQSSVLRVDNTNSKVSF